MQPLLTVLFQAANPTVIMDAIQSLLKQIRVDAVQLLNGGAVRALAHAVSKCPQEALRYLPLSDVAGLQVYRRDHLLSGPTSDLDDAADIAANDLLRDILAKDPDISGMLNQLFEKGTYIVKVRAAEAVANLSQKSGLIISLTHKYSASFLTANVDLVVSSTFFASINAGSTFHCPPLSMLSTTAPTAARGLESLLAYASSVQCKSNPILSLIRMSPPDSAQRHSTLQHLRCALNARYSSLDAARESLIAVPGMAEVFEALSNA